MAEKNNIGNYRWRILAFLFFATTINYIDRQVIGILKPYVADRLGWTEAGYGLIVGAFQLAYALGLLLTGRVLDMVGTKIGYAFAMVVWSIAAAAHATVRSITGFAVVRFVLGFGESANFPAAVKTVAEWFPKKERALATGLFNSGSSVGAILGPMIVSAAFVQLGLNGVFFITGSLGFLWLVFWVSLYHSPLKHNTLSKNEFKYIHGDRDSDVNRISWHRLLPHKETIAICLSRFVTDWVWWFFLFWIPDFLKKMHHVDIKQLRLPLLVIYSAAGIGGILGGWLSSHLIRKGKSIDFARKTAILICALCVLPIVTVTRTSNLWLAIAFISLAAAAHSGWASNIFTVVSDIYPKSAVGSVVGLSGFAGAVGGTMAATGIGYALQFTGNYLLIFSVAGSVYLLAWLILKLLIPRIELLQRYS